MSEFNAGASEKPEEKPAFVVDEFTAPADRRKEALEKLCLQRSAQGYRLLHIDEPSYYSASRLQHERRLLLWGLA